MSNYLRNVAHRAAGASLLRPRVPSRFEPVAGMGPGVITQEMNHFREVVTERVAEVPRTTRTSEVRPTPAPTPTRISETPVHREESRATTRAVEERSVNRKKPDIDQRRPVQEPRTQTDSVPNVPTVARTLRSEITQKPADVRVVTVRDTVAESVQPRQEPTRPIVQTDSPTPVAATTPQFPAPTPERRPERHIPPMKAEPQTRPHEFPVAPARAPYVQPAVPHTEISAPSIHVTIGKVTVQATLPAAAPVHAPARTAAHSGPRLTLERYLDRRGGRP